MGIYQDVFLEMIETNEKSDFRPEKSESQLQKEFVVDQPFLFVLSVDKDIIALGRLTHLLIKISEFSAGNPN